MPTPSQQEIDAVKAMENPYAGYSGFANNPLALGQFTPEVIEALKFNDKGGKNLIIGGQIIERDPGFSFTPASPVTSSTPMGNAVNNLGNNIATASGNQPVITGPDTTALNASKIAIEASIKDRQTELARRRDEEVKRITAEFESAEKNTAKAQKNETGTTTRNLLRIGGALGGSASEQGVLLDLEQTHRDEMNSLVAKRNQAIAQAQNAFNDKDFELAQLLLKNAKETEQAIYDRQQDFNEYTLSLKSEARAEKQAEFEKIKFEKAEARDALDFALKFGIDKPFYVVGGIGYDSTTGEKLSYDEFIKRGGKEDFSNAYLIAPGSQEDKAFVQDLRNKYPDAGITFEDTAESAQAKLQNSRLYRKDTYIAPPGGASGAKTAKQSDIITRARAALAEQAATSQNGKANPNTYRDFMSEYIQAGGDSNDFYKAVSLDQFLSEADRKGDLAGTNLDYKQLGTAEDEARLNELMQKSDGGNDMDKLNDFEFEEFQKLIDKLT